MICDECGDYYVWWVEWLSYASVVSVVVIICGDNSGLKMYWVMSVVKDAIMMCGSCGNYLFWESDDNCIVCAKLVTMMFGDYVAWWVCCMVNVWRWWDHLDRLGQPVPPIHLLRRRGSLPRVPLYWITRGIELITNVLNPTKLALIKTNVWTLLGWIYEPES